MKNACNSSRQQFIQHTLTFSTKAFYEECRFQVGTKCAMPHRSAIMKIRYGDVSIARAKVNTLGQLHQRCYHIHNTKWGQYMNTLTVDYSDLFAHLYLAEVELLLQSESVLYSRLQSLAHATILP